MLAPLLAGMLAQRLVRRLCRSCRMPGTATDHDVELLAGLIAVGHPLHRAQGCPMCQGHGYLGRAGVYEVVLITRAMQSMIHEGAAEADLAAEARLDAPSLLRDGLRLVDERVTKVEEIARVAREV